VILALPGVDQKRISSSIHSHVHFPLVLADRVIIGSDFPAIGTVFERSGEGKAASQAFSSMGFPTALTIIQRIDVTQECFLRITE
jgi:hypothetical protein